jgi:hypothetical protein
LGTYAATTGAAVCLSCPAGSYTNAASGATTCTKCAAGERRAVRCTAARQRAVGLLGAFAARSGFWGAARPCRVSTRKIECLLRTPAGTYSTWDGVSPFPTNVSTCTPCPSGLYSTALGLADVSGCLQCGDGLKTNSLTLPTTCTNCTAGEAGR